MGHKCFSLAFTRVYDERLLCNNCGRHSEFGWMYRCCHETETRLFESIRDGHQEHYDTHGADFIPHLQPPVRGASTRQDKLSPLKEMTPAQLASYSSTQLATLLLQHERAVDTALTERYGYNNPHGTGIQPPAHVEHPHVMSEAEECRNTLCPACGRGGNAQELSYLSIDGIVKGDIPPSVAVGWGFRPLCSRPIADLAIVKNMGLRDSVTGLLPGQEKAGVMQQSMGGGQGMEDAFCNGTTTPTEEVSAEAMRFLGALTTEQPQSSMDATLASQGVDYHDFIHSAGSVAPDETLKATVESSGGFGGGGIKASATSSTTESQGYKDELIRLYGNSRENTPAQSSGSGGGDGIKASATSSTTGSQSYKNELIELYGYSRENTPADDPLAEDYHASDDGGDGGETSQQA